MRANLSRRSAGAVLLSALMWVLPVMARASASLLKDYDVQGSEDGSPTARRYSPTSSSQLRSGSSAATPTRTTSAHRTSSAAT